MVPGKATASYVQVKDSTQWKALNVVILGQRETDNNNRMVTIS